MTSSLGPRTHRVCAALLGRILEGEFRSGDKLPRYLELAAQFRVAPMTVRQVEEVLRLGRQKCASQRARNE